MHLNRRTNVLDPSGSALKNETSRSRPWILLLPRRRLPRRKHLLSIPGWVCTLDSTLLGSLLRSTSSQLSMEIADSPARRSHMDIDPLHHLGSSISHSSNLDKVVRRPALWAWLGLRPTHQVPVDLKVIQALLLALRVTQVWLPTRDLLDPPASRMDLQLARSRARALGGRD